MGAETPKRRKVFEVKKPTTPMVLTPRDVEVVRAVQQYRMLTREQIQKLIFPNIRREVAQRRLRELYHHGYVKRVPMAVAESPLAPKKPIYRLGPRGAKLLAKEQGMEVKEFSYWGKGDDKDGRVTKRDDLFFAHELEINDFRIAVNLRAAQQGLVVERWMDEPTLRGFKDMVEVEGKSVWVVPDAYFWLFAPPKKDYHFLLELDRSTMTNARFGQKVEAYEAYLKSGKYTQRFKTKAVRILTVAKSGERLANLKRVVEAKMTLKGIYWFTTLKQVVEEDVLTAAIWKIAGEETISPLLI